MPALFHNVVALPLRGLTWLGGPGPRAVAAVVFIALAVPPLGALLRPYVTEAIFVLLCISFMRVDLAALTGHLRRPALVGTATVWTMIGVPVIVGLIVHLTGLTARAPDLALALMLQSMASPMMAAPALAARVGGGAAAGGAAGPGARAGAGRAGDGARAGAVPGPAVREPVPR